MNALRTRSAKARPARTAERAMIASFAAAKKPEPEHVLEVPDDRDESRGP